MRFHWLKEPTTEHSTSSHAWPAKQLDIPVVSPEVTDGRIQTRAEWIIQGASDISSYNIGLGWITAAMKAVHLREAHGLRQEVHSGGPGNLQVLGAMRIPGEHYERDLLHLMLGYEQSTPLLKVS